MKVLFNGKGGEIVGIFDKFKNRNITKTRFEMVEKNNGLFIGSDGNIYESDVIRSAMKPRAVAVSKLIPEHIRQSETDFKTNPDPYLRVLLEEPNPLYSMQMLLEQTCYNLSLNGNAFILIVRDENNIPIELYNINCVQVEAVYNENGRLYLKFINKNGKQVVYPYSDIIHLRENFNGNDLFGTSPKDSLIPLMNLVKSTDRSILNAIKNSSTIRYLLKFSTSLRNEDVVAKTNEFKENFLSQDNTQIGGIDSKADLIQLNQPEQYVPNKEASNSVINRIYNFFGVNENIIQNKYNEDEWNSFYENQIEPLAMQLSSEFTRKLFNRRERAFGNKIMFTANNLQYASMQTKLGLVSYVDRSIMSTNEVRTILNLRPVEGGDTFLLRKDTGVVDNGVQEEDNPDPNIEKTDGEGGDVNEDN